MKELKKLANISVTTNDNGLTAVNGYILATDDGLCSLHVNWRVISKAVNDASPRAFISHEDASFEFYRLENLSKHKRPRRFNPNSPRGLRQNVERWLDYCRELSRDFRSEIESTCQIRAHNYLKFKRKYDGLQHTLRNNELTFFSGRYNLSIDLTSGHQKIKLFSNAFTSRQIGDLINYIDGLSVTNGL